MTAQEAISYIESYTWSTTRLGLGRTRELLQKLGNPQKKLKFVHVAGSNGKGSTCAMLSSILRKAGYCTGLYTSPYIQNFCERIQVDGENIPDDALATITQRVLNIAESMADHPSQFELVTAVAIEYFYQRRCDIVVLEVGMGGALDSTNVIDAPEVAVITNIGLEHTEYLGHTLGEIAAAKAGIIKQGCSCVCYDCVPEVMTVIKAVCAEENVPLTCADFSEARALRYDLNGQQFSWKGKEYSLSLLGPHQINNATVVLETIAALCKRGWTIHESAVIDGLRDVKWPARLEILSREPLFILDGGHNPQCAEALVSSLNKLFPGQKAVFLIGVLADKDYGQILELMMPVAQEFVCLTPLSDRALSADNLADYLVKQGATARACADIPTGIDQALAVAGERGLVVAFGSLYLAGAVRSCYAKALKHFQRKYCISVRRALTEEQRKEASLRVCERLKTLPELQNARVIFSYSAAWDEVDLTEFHQWAKMQGIKIAFPVSHNGGIMEAMIPRDDESWEIGKYGILSPMPERSEPVHADELDAVLVPCVGFDLRGGRLGHGGGYYDRYLSRCSQAKKVLVAFDAQQLPCVGREKTDQSIGIIVTESTESRTEYNN